MNETTVKMQAVIDSIISNVKIANPDDKYYQSETAENGTVVETKRITRKLFGTVGKGKDTITFMGDIVDEIADIDRLLGIEKESKFQIARAIYRIGTSANFKTYGFKSVGDFCSKVFDMKNGNASLYYRVGKFFMKENTEGVPVIRDTLKGFGFSQVAELLPLVSEVRQAEYLEDNNAENIDDVLDNFVESALLPIKTQKLAINEMSKKDDVRKAVNELYPKALTPEELAKKEASDKKKADKEAIEKFYKDYNGKIKAIAGTNILIAHNIDMALEYMDKIADSIDEDIATELISIFEAIKKNTVDMEKLIVVEDTEA